MRDDAYRLARISEVGRQLLSVVDERSIDEEAVLRDFEVQWLITTPLYNIGEQANCVSRACADAHPEVPWAQIAGLRHRLVHDYEGVNWKMIAAVLFDELPEVVEQIEGLLGEGEMHCDTSEAEGVDENRRGHAVP
ncbi:HepT-like ribonuclease domain-containing protein [Adlercreutzia sp. R21]|uniref:HepT-like ribonuclease domain-containing protein n=1 Tax=Adlercreutzia wanghongyangiae TaxID=3111451 RepID=UPI002DBA0493|nr:HepT-like ribonuclease domain-containing protein [Adlercreutzia sp. R21]MEC4183995.1 HepT-like ribonuclease domain-containing protein [Adlercreutzia sp. R21]